jgi:hypothetical protein
MLNLLPKGNRIAQGNLLARLRMLHTKRVTELLKKSEHKHHLTPICRVNIQSQMPFIAKDKQSIDKYDIITYVLELI